MKYIYRETFFGLFPMLNIEWGIVRFSGGIVFKYFGFEVNDFLLCFNI